MRSGIKRDEELRATIVCAVVCHSHEASSRKERIGSFVFESQPIYRLSSFASKIRVIATLASEITTLAHKALDDAMKRRALVMKFHLERFANAHLASAQSDEVVASERQLVAK